MSSILNSRHSKSRFHFYHVCVGPKKRGAASASGEADRFFLNSFAYFSFSIKKSMWGLGLAPIFKMQDFKLNPDYAIEV
jgi:hypothetical protein